MCINAANASGASTAATAATASFDLLTFKKVGSGLRMGDFVYQNHRGNFFWNGQSMKRDADV